MEDFMKSNRRIGEVSWTKQRVVDAYDRLNHCSAGVDGTKKTLFALFFNHFLHLVHFLFCQLAASCYILQKLEHIHNSQCTEKKGLSLTDLDNFKGIHLLSCLRQWFVESLLPDLENVANEHTASNEVNGIKQSRAGVA